MLDNGTAVITVFTPTYNRAYILPQLYDSLKSQTNSRFVWLIVDDGSTDGTDALVAGWKSEGHIVIEYIRQNNAGKMKAHNVGVERTSTELFVCVDSDDWLLSNSIELILEKWNRLSLEERARTAGLIAYRGKTVDTVIGNHFPDGLETSSLSDLYRKGFKGDTTIIFKRDVVKRYPFPIIDGEKFITEAYVFDQIDQTYTYYLIPSILIVCEYRIDGLTRNLLKLLFNNPCGYTAYYIQRANFSRSMKEKLLNYIRANCFRHQIKNKKMPIKPKNRFLYNLTYPAGVLLYLGKRKAYKKVSKWEN